MSQVRSDAALRRAQAAYDRMEPVECEEVEAEEEAELTAWDVHEDRVMEEKHLDLPWDD